MSEDVPAYGSASKTGNASLHQTLMTGYETAVRSSAENIELVHGRHWDSRLDVVRTLVTIAAAIFAGTITFLDKVSPAISIVQCCLLGGSWILLASSIAAGIVVMWQSVTLRGFHPKAFNGQIFVGKQFSTLDLRTPGVVDQATKILKNATDGLFNAIGAADARAETATNVCLVSFFGSMLAFLVYAIVRL